MIPVSLVVLSHNRLEELSKNLPRLLSERQSCDEFEIIVVDNASTDGSKEFLIQLQKEHSEIVLALNKQNLGVGGGRNAGFSLARREYVVAIDDDTSIGAEDLRQIPCLFQKYRDAGILAFRIIHSISGELQNPHGDVACGVANHHGAGFAFRRFLYDVVGGIDEECDYGAEELDFAIRVHAQGWKVLYVPELTVQHSSLKRDLKDEQWRRTRRLYNNVRIYHKYFPEWMASRNSQRYAIIAVRSWLLNYGLSGIGNLVNAYRAGKKAGITNHQLVPDATVYFYNSESLRPEFGNVPILRKVWNRLRLHTGVGTV